MQLRSISFLSFAVILSALAGCGESKTEAPPSEPAAEAPKPALEQAAPKMAPAPEGATIQPDENGVVHIGGNDQMRFTASRIEAKAGKFKVELTNVGALPKEAMAHNFIVLKPGSDIAAVGAAAVAAKPNDYIPTDAAIIAHTRLLGPGESDTIELDLPAGTYPFMCSFPGHFALMRGELVVE